MNKNLYGWASNNDEATKRTLATLTAFWNVLPAGEIDGCIVVRTNRQIFSKLAQAKHEYYTLADNGGEICVEPINCHDEMRSVPSTSNKGIVTAEVMAYRLWCAITGQEIDYDCYDIPHFHEIAKEPLRINVDLF